MKMKVRAFVFLGFLVTVWSIEERPVVHTKNGPVRGFVQNSSKGKTIYFFLSIPYAAPPIGKLRFKVGYNRKDGFLVKVLDSNFYNYPVCRQPPQPAQKWNQILEGTSLPPVCIQFERFIIKRITGEEDCLYLNIFSRELPYDGHNPKLPVMIWIHGGGFTSGSSEPLLYNPTLLLNEDIVMVSINYRLGPFGFMSTADEVIQGNMGLKDQSLAFRWVKENIEAFGGDTDRITIFGHSSGSASVHLHLLSSMSRGLFHRAIAQSGTAMDTWAYVEPHQIASRAKRLSSWVDCPTENSQDMLNCLQDVDANKIAALVPKFADWFVFPLVPFSPTKEVGGDDRFLDKSPEESLQKGLVADVPLLCGNTDSEAEVFTEAILKEKGLLQDVNDRYLQVFPTLLEYNHLVDNPHEYSQRIREYYFGENEISEKTLPEFTKMISDVYFNYWGYTAIRQLQAVLVKSPVYYYQMSFLGSIGTSPVPGLPSYKPSGVGHGDDLLYIFQMPFTPPFKEGSPDYIMSNKMVSWWVNFAYTGNPTPYGGKESDVIWDPLESSYFNYFNITLPPKMQTDFIYDRLDFWRTLYGDIAASQVEAKDDLYYYWLEYLLG